VTDGGWFHFPASGPLTRNSVARFVRSLFFQENLVVFPASNEAFLGALASYEVRPDKGYKLDRLHLDVCDAQAGAG
jgi:hypothetical protein